MHVFQKLVCHEGKSASPVARRLSFGCSIVVDLHGEVEVDEDEVVLTIAFGVHDVADADVSMKNMSLVSQVMNACIGSNTF